MVIIPTTTASLASPLLEEPALAETVKKAQGAAISVVCHASLSTSIFHFISQVGLLFHAPRYTTGVLIHLCSPPVPGTVAGTQEGPSQGFRS